MGTTGNHRLAIDAAETLAAIMDRQIDLIGLLALQPALQRRPDLLRELDDAADDMITARQIIFRWRAHLHAGAGGGKADDEY